MTRDLDSPWQEILTTATLGTERRKAEAPPTGGLIGEVIDRVDASNPERHLLVVSAAIAIYRKAGQIPPVISIPLPPACEPDERLRCSPAASSRLATILSGQFKEVLPEWLALGEKAGRLVPEKLLPELLSWGEAHLDQVELLLPVMGRRGRWLASLNPAWAEIKTASLVESAAPEPLEEAWQTGERNRRRLLLRLLREKSAQSGRDLVASTWAEESAGDRTAFLEAFETNLSMEDEPFLESALDDRSKDVRQAAAWLLACLSQSRLVERMTRRIQPLLKLEPGRWPLRRARIEVALPEAYDADMNRDGVERKPPRGQTVGEKAWWLLQMLEAVPPSVWSRAWDKPPAELVENAADGDWHELLLTGWVTATLRHHEADWAESLLKIYPHRTQLLEVLAPDRRETLMYTLIQSQPKEGMATAIGYQHPWSQALTRLVLKNLRQYFITDEGMPFFSQLHQALLNIGLYMHPELIPEAERILRGKEDDGSAWEQAVESLLQLLEFRRQMIEELKL